MKTLSLFFCMLASLSLQARETAYITDRAEVFLRAGEGTQYKITERLYSGTQLTVLKRNPTTGYSKVKLENGHTGWLLTRFLIDHPGAGPELEKANQVLASLKEENQHMKEELDALRATRERVTSEQQELQKEKLQISNELNTIRHAATHAVEIKQERDILQDRVVKLERETQKLQRDKQTLENSTAQDWFIRGAGVLLGGIVIGLILPKLSWRRKSRQWDAF